MVKFANLLPDPRVYKKARPENPENLVVYAKTSGSYYYPRHTTPYLMVANFKGAGHYTINNRPACIDDKVFYFLNQGDDIEIRFKNLPVETLLVLFSDRLIKDFSGYKGQNMESLLANGCDTTVRNFTVPTIPLEYNASITRCLSKLRPQEDPQELESTLVDLLDALWTVKENMTDRLGKMEAKKKTTKEEIYKRLLVARHFMHDNVDLPLTVDAISKEACLNKFYLIKLFKEFYGASPHQYLVKLKLARAYTLLAAGRASVLDACREVGFESQGTFTNLFKRTYGFPPSQLRKGGTRNSQQ